MLNLVPTSYRQSSRRCADGAGHGTIDPSDHLADTPGTTLAGKPIFVPQQPYTGIPAALSLSQNLLLFRWQMNSNSVRIAHRIDPDRGADASRESVITSRTHLVCERAVLNATLSGDVFPVIHLEMFFAQFMT